MFIPLRLLLCVRSINNARKVLKHVKVHCTSSILYIPKRYGVRSSLKRPVIVMKCNSGLNVIFIRFVCSNWLDPNAWCLTVFNAGHLNTKCVPVTYSPHFTHLPYEIIPMFKRCFLR